MEQEDERRLLRQSNVEREMSRKRVLYVIRHEMAAKFNWKKVISHRMVDK